MLYIYSVVLASVILFFPGISMAKKVINLSDREIWVISSQLHLFNTSFCFFFFYTCFIRAELLEPKLWPSQLNPNCGCTFHILLSPFLECLFCRQGMLWVQPRLWILSLLSVWTCGLLHPPAGRLCLSSGRRKGLKGGGSKAQLVPWCKWVLPGWRRAGCLCPAAWPGWCCARCQAVFSSSLLP